jgi:hypothetical protein
MSNKKKRRDGPSPREAARRAAQATTATGQVRPPAPDWRPPLITAAPAAAEPLTAEDYRGASTFPYLLPTRQKTVQIKRTDLFSLFMADAVPMNLLAVIGELDNLQRSISDNPAILATMKPEMKRIVTDAIDRVIVQVVASPHIVLTREEAGPGKLWVGEVILTDKLSMFLAAQFPPPPKPGEFVHVAPPRLEGDAAREFRGNEPKPDGAVVSDGQSVRAKTVVVDDPVAGKVEYVGA